MIERRQAQLVLADGTTFCGDAIGAFGLGGDDIATGELIFNTAMSGYQEVITDPSYAGQVVAFTYPHIGNYGVSHRDDESRATFLRGVIVRELSPRGSSWRSNTDLERFLLDHGVGGMTGVDTRRLTRHVRSAGAMACAFGTAPTEDLLRAAQTEPGTLGADLVREVTTERSYRVGDGEHSVVAYDFGIKSTILTSLSAIARVEVVPASTPASDVLERHPDGVFLSNGPGDPAALAHLTVQIDQLLGKVPIFGICLGHQLLAQALGAGTFKLPFGHHGANHPVKRLSSGSIEITSHNHGFAVDDVAIAGVEITHRNLNDGVVEGLSATALRAFSVQYHPEAAPGPHDASYLFGEFAGLMERSR